MAIVEVGIASFQVGDSAKKLASGSFYVTAAKARLYIAAADQTARDATAVGLLLTTALSITRASRVTPHRSDITAAYLRRLRGSAMRHQRK